MRPVTAPERRGPNELAVWHDFQVAALHWGQLAAIRVYYLREEFAARLQIYLAVDRAVGFRAEPGHQMFRRSPGLEQQLWRHIHYTL